MCHVLSAYFLFTRTLRFTLALVSCLVSSRLVCSLVLLISSRFCYFHCCLDIILCTVQFHLFINIHRIDERTHRVWLNSELFSFVYTWTRNVSTNQQTPSMRHTLTMQTTIFYLVPPCGHELILHRVSYNWELFEPGSSTAHSPYQVHTTKQISIEMSTRLAYDAIPDIIRGIEETRLVRRRLDLPHMFKYKRNASHHRPYTLHYEVTVCTSLCALPNGTCVLAFYRTMKWIELNNLNQTCRVVLYSRLWMVFTGYSCGCFRVIGHATLTAGRQRSDINCNVLWINRADFYVYVVVYKLLVSSGSHRVDMSVTRKKNASSINTRITQVFLKVFWFSCFTPIQEP